MAGNLNPRQARFVAEYQACGNATEAARRAGYSAKTAKQQGHRLLTKADVAQAVSQKQARTVETLEITAEKVLQEVAGIAFLPHEALGGTVRASDKLKALELLGKTSGLELWTEKIKHDTSTPLEHLLGVAHGLAKQRSQQAQQQPGASA